MAYPETVTIIPNKSSEAHLGLKSIEWLRLKAGWRLLLARSVKSFSSTVGPNNGHICWFFWLIFSVNRSLNMQPVQLIHNIQFNSRSGFQIYILTGDMKKNCVKLKALSMYLSTLGMFTHYFMASVPNRKLLDVLNIYLLGYEWAYASSWGIRRFRCWWMNSQA